MKTRFLTLMMLLMTMATSLRAQEAVATDGAETTPATQQQDPCSKYGPDSSKTLDEASIYTEFYKQKNYEAALPHWRYVYNNAPGYHEAVIANGMVMYKYLIDNETDSLKKEALVDTLLAMYDKRIECYGKACFNLGRKGYDLMKYRPRDYDNIRATYQAAMDECELSPEYFILYPYVKLMAYEYRKGTVTKEEMFAVYEKVAAIVNHNKSGQYGDKYEATFESVVEELKGIGILNCDNLREYYGNVYRNDPDNPEVWNQVSAALASCNTCDTLFLQMEKKLFEVAPSADLATNIANCEKEIGTRANALLYLDRAMELEEDSEQKAKLAYTAARILYDMDRFTEARNYAYKAAQLKPGWGDPYLLIGTMYISSGNICKNENPFYGYAVSLVAVDKFIQARNIDASVADEANRLIAKYSEYFPTPDAAFERDLAEGSSYTVGCWINESTTIRVKR